MDQMNQMPQEPAPMPKKGSDMNGMIAIIVIVVLLVLGGAYYLLFSPNSMMESANTEDGDMMNDPDVQATLSQSDSDNLSDIEADVNATDFGSIDAALGEMEQ